MKTWPRFLLIPLVAYLALAPAYAKDPKLAQAVKAQAVKAQAAAETKAAAELREQRLALLPESVREFLFYEQERVDRGVNPRRLIPPTPHEDIRYNPEGRNVFEVKSFWVDADQLDTFKGTGLDPGLAKTFTRMRDGKKQVRFLLHPESEKFFAKLIAKSEPGEVFYATATASSRSCVIWREGVPPFIGKLSLDVELGGVRRTIPLSEVPRSIGTNNTIEAARKTLPDSFKTFPETLGVMPKGMDRGGMILRQFPEGMLEGKERYVPVFALYAEPPGGKAPMLADMIRKSGMSATDFMREKIYRPFARQWLQMTIHQGISMEPHGQNMLVELGPDGLPDGNFVHRDMGGFDVAFPYREKAGLPVPKDLPVIRDFTKEYHQAMEAGEPEYEGALGRSIYTHFESGAVYNLDKRIQDWIKKGWIPKQEIKRFGFSLELKRAFEQEYQALTGESRKLTATTELKEWVLDARGKMLSCAPAQMKRIIKAALGR